ncbi:MAG: hypothetical protein ACTSQI_19425 [Candidatus Helarchaeota archaeon]
MEEPPQFRPYVNRAVKPEAKSRYYSSHFSGINSSNPLPYILQIRTAQAKHALAILAEQSQLESFIQKIGIDYLALYEYQEKGIRMLFGGLNLFVVLRTGGGKSLIAYVASPPPTKPMVF